MYYLLSVLLTLTVAVVQAIAMRQRYVHADAGWRKLPESPQHYDLWCRIYLVLSVVLFVFLSTAIAVTFLS